MIILQEIKKVLLHYVSEIDNGNCNLSDKELVDIFVAIKKAEAEFDVKNEKPNVIHFVPKH